MMFYFFYMGVWHINPIPRLVLKHPAETMVDDDDDDGCRGWKHIFGTNGGGFIMIHPVFWGHDLRVTHLFFLVRNGLFQHVDTTKGKNKSWNFGRVISTHIPAHPIQSKKTSRNSDVVFQGHPRQAACVAVVWLRGWFVSSGQLSIPFHTCPYFLLSPFCGNSRLVHAQWRDFSCADANPHAQKLHGDLSQRPVGKPHGRKILHYY